MDHDVTNQVTNSEDMFFVFLFLSYELGPFFLDGFFQGTIIRTGRACKKIR